MSGTALDHPLVRDYLRDLGQALAVLPPGAGQRADRADHRPPGRGPAARHHRRRDRGRPGPAGPPGRPGRRGHGRPTPRSRPGQPAERRRLRWPRLGWRRWTAIGAAVLIVAAGAGYLIAMATTAPIQFANVYCLVVPAGLHPRGRHPGRRETADHGADPLRPAAGVCHHHHQSKRLARDRARARLRSGQPGSRSVQIGVSPLNVDNGGFPTRRLRFYRPFTIPPHQTRILRVMWTSDHLPAPGPDERDRPASPAGARRLVHQDRGHPASRGLLPVRAEPRTLHLRHPLTPPPRPAPRTPRPAGTAPRSRTTPPKPIAPMDSASTGGVAAARAFWPVFWMPSARPAQAEPAYSAMAVAASPLVLTATTPQTSRITTATGERSTAAPARASSAIPVVTARMRIGRIRLPVRSDQ